MTENLFSHPQTKSLICDFYHCTLLHASLLPVATFRAGDPEVQYVDLRLERKLLIKINAQKYPCQGITFSTCNHPAATDSTLQVLPSMCSVLPLLLYLQVHVCAHTLAHGITDINASMWLQATATLITPQPESSRRWIPTPWLHFKSARASEIPHFPLQTRFLPSLDSPQTTTTTCDSINSFHTSPLACMETSSALLIGRVQITAVALAANHYSTRSLNVANQACLVYYALCE